MEILTTILFVIIYAAIYAYKIDESGLTDFDFWKMLWFFIKIIGILFLIISIAYLFGIDLTFILEIIPFPL